MDQQTCIIGGGAQLKAFRGRALRDPPRTQYVLQQRSPLNFIPMALPLGRCAVALAEATLCLTIVLSTLPRLYFPKRGRGAGQ